MNNQEFIDKVAKMTLEQLSKEILIKESELIENEFELFKSSKKMIDNLFNCWKNNEPTEKAGKLAYEYLTYKLMGGK